MEALSHSLSQALRSVHRERRRLYPMALGIIWGMASVMVLLAVAGGFEASQRSALAAYGERFIYLRLNRAELDRAAGTEERRLMMDELDLERLRNGAPAIVRFTPINMAYRARITGRSGAGTNTYVAGAMSEIARIRNLPLEEGRFFNEIDEEERARVIVLGPIVRRQLFGARQAVGQKVRIAGFSTAMIPTRETAAALADPTRRRDLVRARDTDPGRIARSSALRRSMDRRERVGAATSGIQGEIFTVIGVLEDVEIQSESYVSVARMAFVPFSTSCAVFDQDFNTMMIEPRTAEDRELALRQFRQVMGARYGFDEDDRNAVVIYFDSVERARRIGTIFGAIRWFLSAVGLLILGIGAIGVMNVVLVSVASRRFEIGLRKALGATPGTIYVQFFAETLFACFASGALGFLLGIAGIALLQGLPLPEGFSRPVIDAGVAALAFGLLAVVATAAGFYPARRAAALAPVEALRAR
jgi:ABC-type antimicrobial peptide transport system permease subunit